MYDLVEYQRDPKESCRFSEFSKESEPRESPGAVTRWSPGQNCSHGFDALQSR